MISKVRHKKSHGKYRKPRFIILAFIGIALFIVAISPIRKIAFYFSGLYSETTLTPPRGYPIQGVDVSSYQLWIDWDTVKTQNVSFAIIKASEGATHKDAFFSRNWKNCKKAGIKRGAYHFFRPKVNGDKQVKNYLEAVKFEKGDLVPVLDVEVFDADTNKFYLELNTWLKSIEKISGRKPIIYTYRWFYNKYLSRRYSAYPLWIASYRTDEPKFGKNWKIWQYTDGAKIKGIPGRVDHNVFNGPINRLEELSF